MPSRANSAPLPTPTARNLDLSGGVALGIATVAALIVANSPLAPCYEDLLELTSEIRIGSIGLAQNVGHRINDGLMAVFFLQVGLEIKRELLDGALSGPRKAALPALAAMGGLSCRY